MKNKLDSASKFIAALVNGINISKNHFFAFCLTVVVLITALAYLAIFSKIDAKIEILQQLQQEQLNNIQFTVSEINQMKIEMGELQQQLLGSEKRIDMLYSATSSHENCVALAMMINHNSILAEQFNRTESQQEALYKNDQSFAKFVGRLYVPDAQIDVALYRGYEQYICDREDSANLFTWGLYGCTYEGEFIADHSTQEFRKLFSVKVGMTGYIKLENGDIINIVCTEIINGRNTGKQLTDEQGNDEFDADYAMYTCRNGWQNIRICLWKQY